MKLGILKIMAVIGLLVFSLAGQTTGAHASDGLPKFGVGGKLSTVDTQLAQGRRANGQFCRRGSQCRSGYCANRRKCAPRDGTGRAGAYCHHNNHCATKLCNCNKDAFGACRGWERWPAGTFRSGGRASLRIGFCAGKKANAAACTRNSQCASGHCANGKRCAPRDNTGRKGAYCHHDNHCRTRSCVCPGRKSFGFCVNWERFSPRTMVRMNRNAAGFMCN